MPKTGRNIYKRKDCRWEGRYIKRRDANDKIIYGSVYGKSYTDVKHQLEIVNTNLAKSNITAKNKRNITLTEVTNQWLLIISLKVKTTTYARYKTTLESHILPSLGKRKMQSLTAVIISRFAKNKLENGRKDGKGGLSSKTVRDMLSIIKSIIDYSCKEKIINNNFSIAYPKQWQRSMRVLSRQEQSALEKVLINNIDIYKLGILLCLYTGIRIGEVCALRWKDISDDFTMLSVRQTLQRVKNIENNKSKTKIHIDEPKSLSSVRDIPIPEFLSSYLRRFYRDSHIYFLGIADANFIEPRTMQNHFAKVIKTANIITANYHSLRHTFATRCIEAGMDIKSLSEILGHASVNITLNRYVHSSFEQKKEGMNKLERYIGI